MVTGMIRKIILITLLLGLTLIISGCINPQIDMHTQTVTHTKTITVTSTQEDSSPVSHSEKGKLSLTSYRVLQDNGLPFKAQVIKIMKGKTTATIAIRITKTSNYDPKKEYYIDFITSFNHELLRIVHYTDNLKPVRNYNCENNWCEGVEFKYTGGDGATVLVIIGDKDFNILTNSIKYYDTIKIGYFIKNGEYSKIFLGRSTIQFIYS